MARRQRDARLETREARRRLKIAHDPYWRGVHPGLAVGYRKGRRGGVWLVRYLVDGKYRKKKLGLADDYADANGKQILDYSQAHRKALEFADAPAPSSGRLGPYTVEDAMRDYLDWFKAHRKGHKQTTYMVEGQILPALGKKAAAELTPATINRWLQKLATAPVNRRGKRFAIDPDDAEAVRKRKATANRILTVLKAGLNHAWAEGLLDRREVWQRVKPFREVDQPKIRFLSQPECTRLINGCAAEFRPLVEGALLTGLRYGELCRLRAEDFEQTAGSVCVRQAKGGRARHVPLTDEGVAFFTAHTAGRSRGEHIFCRADGAPWGTGHQTRRMQAASHAARIDPPVSFHDLRNTYGSLLAAQAVPLHVISEVLGHSDTRMTQRHYAHLQPSYVADTIRAHLPRFGAKGSKKVTPLKPKRRAR